MRRIFITIGIIVLLMTFGLIWWKTGLGATNPNNTKLQTFVVTPGQGIREISKNLKDHGLIKNQIVFFLLTKKLGLDKRIEAGDYRISPSMSADEIATDLTHGTQDIWITIPEGNRSDEIADVLKEKMPSYLEDWRKILNENEGYLFPDTYLFPKDATIELIVQTMKNNFDTKYASLNTSKTDLTKNQIVNIASLVEREAKTDKDRPLVAGVILNRLEMGMKLDLDATIQYALGYQPDEKRWWKRSLTQNDLELSSTYNTYNHNGLPPTPISNPGLASLRAVINPATTNFLYYISDAKGINHYATDLEGQQENIKKYGLQ